jgi:hypothetical protein
MQWMAVDDRFFEKHEYHALIPEQKNNMRLNRLERGHVGNGHGGNGNGTGKSNSKVRSNHSPAPSRRWLPNLTILACLMMMMMNPQRRRKSPPTAQMLI